MVATDYCIDVAANHRLATDLWLLFNALCIYQQRAFCTSGT